MDNVKLLEKVCNKKDALLLEISKDIVGQKEVIEHIFIALLCKGHILLEGVPGLGKTLIVKSITKALDLKFNRIQFTPDLLPSDVTGVSIYNQQSNEFEFRSGPIISQVVLADEINRATPKTQSSLLEAMEERQVTVDGVTHKMPSPFMVMATQNPIEYEGTFPLPEAQLDRFLIRVNLGYPSADDEVTVLDEQQVNHPVDSLSPVTDPSEIAQVQGAVREVYIDPLIKQYIVALAGATREHEDVYLGASPRGSIALLRTSQASALLDGRDYVIPDDVKDLVFVSLEHRIIISPGARVKGTTAADILADCLGRVAVPGTRPKA